MRQLLIAAVLGLLICPTAIGQQDKIDSSENDTPKQLIQQIKNHIAKQQWDAASKLMTGEAWDDFCAQLVVEAITLTNIEFEFMMPGIEETQDKLADVLKKYGLDQLEVKVPSIEIRKTHGGGGEESEEIEADIKAKLKERQAKRQEQNKEMLVALNKIPDRFAVVNELWQAQKGSPITKDLFSGTIEEQKIDGDSAVLKIKLGTSRSGSEDSGAVIVIEAPPVFVNLSKQDGDWKYCGINREKTMEALKNFKPSIRGNDAKSDF